ncbi:MAG: NRDE family protein [Planctomycetota bacterium]
MCVAIISFRELPDWPIFIASNRDEYYDRPSSPPALQNSGGVTYLAPRDERAGGTWIGVNQHQLFAVITNRSDLSFGTPLEARSRGLLVQDLLQAGSLAQAVTVCQKAISQPSAPYNLVFGTSKGVFLAAVSGAGSGTLRELPPGSHVVTNHGEANDSSVGEVRRARALWQQAQGKEPWQAAREILSLNIPAKDLPPLCKDHGNRGTVSSTLVGISKAGEIQMLHAHGPPVSTPYQQVVFRRAR